MTTRSNSKSVSNLNTELLQLLDNKFEDFKIHFLEKTFEDFKNNIVEVIKNEFQEEINELKKKVFHLEKQIESNDQFNRSNNVIISGIPETNNENVYEILSKIGATAGCNITRHEVDFASRIAPRTNRDAKNGKPRNIIVKLTRRYLKDELIAAIRKRKGMVASELQLPGTSKIYINDHLTPKNQLLLRQCRDIKFAGKIRYCWVRNCKIFTRISDSTPIILITNQEDVNKLSTLKSTQDIPTSSAVPLGN